MRHYKEKHIYVGVDLHKHTHTAVIINCWNEKLGEIQFNNIPNAFPDFLQQIKGFAKRGVTPLFDLEDVGGYGRSLAVYLLELKQKVKEVNMALSFACRTQKLPNHAEKR